MTMEIPVPPMDIHLLNCLLNCLHSLILALHSLIISSPFAFIFPSFVQMENDSCPTIASCNLPLETSAGISPGTHAFVCGLTLMLYRLKDFMHYSISTLTHKFFLMFSISSLLIFTQFFGFEKLMMLSAVDATTFSFHGFYCHPYEDRSQHKHVFRKTWKTALCWTY